MLKMFNLDAIPHDKQMRDICEIAVEQCGLALEYVNPEFITPKLCLTAISQTSLALRYVPPDILTLEMCEIAVKKFGLSLQHVPEKFRTHKIIHSAVTNCGWALMYVKRTPHSGVDSAEPLETPLCGVDSAEPQPLKKDVSAQPNYYDICKEAVSNVGLALEFVPEEFKTDEMCQIALKQHKSAKMYFPKSV
jgi:hypothetical protein